MPMCLTPCSSGTFHTVLSDAFIRFLLSLRVVTTSYTWLPPLSLTLRKPPKAGYPLHPHAVAVKHATLNLQRNLMLALTYLPPWLWNMPWPHAGPHLPPTVAVKHAMTPCWPSLTTHTPWLWNMPWPHADPHLPTTHCGCETCHDPTLTLTYQPHTVAVKHAMTPRWPSLTNHTPWLWNMPWPHADPHLPPTHRGCETCHDPTLTLTYQPHTVAVKHAMIPRWPSLTSHTAWPWIYSRTSCWLKLLALPLTCMYKRGTKLRDLPLHVHCSSCSHTHSQSPGSKACGEFGCHTCLYINHSIC